MRLRTVGLMTALMAARLEAKLGMRLEEVRPAGRRPFVAVKAFNLQHNTRKDDACTGQLMFPNVTFFRH